MILSTGEIIRSFISISIVLKILSSINILAFKATEAVERGLLAADPLDLGFKVPSNNLPGGQEAAQALSETIKTEVENGVHQLETLLEAKIDKNFDRLEIYALRNILNVPANVQDWVRLSHYEGLNFSSSDELPNTESISMQRKKLRETQKLHAWLRAESARNKATIAALKSLTANGTLQQADRTEPKEIYPAFTFLQNKGDLTGDISRPVTTSASFAVSQVPALESLLNDLKLRLQKLAEIDDTAGSAMKDKQDLSKERLEFIEKETRRHLQVVRGLELGEQGDVRDGEWQGGGRNISKQEVIDLEKFVQATQCPEEKNIS